MRGGPPPAGGVVGDIAHAAFVGAAPVGTVRLHEGAVVAGFSRRGASPRLKGRLSRGESCYTVSLSWIDAARSHCSEPGGRAEREILDLALFDCGCPMRPLVIVILYFSGLVGVGLLESRKRKSVEHFLVAGRRGGFLAIFGSLAATIIGGSATLGLCAMAARSGLGAAVWLWGGATGLLLASWLVYRMPRRDVSFTVPEMLGASYGPSVEVVSAALIVTAWLGVIAAQFVAAGLILSVLTGLPATGCLAGVAVVLTAYVWLGGQATVIRTDFIQLTVIITGFALLGGFVWSAGHAVPPGDALREAAGNFIANLGQNPGPHLGLFLVTAVLYLSGPDIFTRFFCARSSVLAGWAARAAGVTLLGFGVFIAALGVLGASLLPLERTEALLPRLAVLVLPEWLWAIVFAAMLGAVMSSADTCLITASSILAWETGSGRSGGGPPRLVRRTGLALLVVGALSLLLALLAPSIIRLLLAGYQLYAGAIAPLLIPAALGLAYKMPRQGVWWMLSGGILAGGWSAVSGDNTSLGLWLAGCGLVWIVAGWASKNARLSPDSRPGHSETSM